MEISSEESSGEIAVDQEMRRLKLDALENGLHTDFSFLVGQDKRTALLIHCLKFDLLMASEYFGELIRSGDPCPVHIRHIQPHIFKLLIRFVSVHNLDKISCLEDGVLLARAADEYLLEPLQTFCRSEIERMVTVECSHPRCPHDN